jgi:hypothetical protein
MSALVTRLRLRPGYAIQKVRGFRIVMEVICTTNAGMVICCCLVAIVSLLALKEH